MGRMQVCTSLQTDNHASTSPHYLISGSCTYLQQMVNVCLVFGQQWEVTPKKVMFGGTWPLTFTHTHTHTHTTCLMALCLGLPGWAGTRQVKTSLDFTEARDSEWQWHPLGHMQVCTSLQTDNHASTPPLSFLQAGCPSCRPTNSVKALKAQYVIR